MNKRSFVSLFTALLILLGTIHPASVFAASSDNWSNSTVPSVFSAKGVVYENGKYLTVGASGAVLFYTDSSVFFGSTFIDGSANLNNIIYNDGKSVIVGDEGKIFSLSMDSERVTERFTANYNPAYNLMGIAYGDGKYVAVGSGGTIVTSPPDRRTWTQQTSNTVSDLGDVTYGNEQYVVVGSVGTIVTSANGETWMAQTSNTTNNLAGVTYGNEQYVAVGSGGTIVTSADGETWTVQTSNTTENLARVTYGNGLFVAVGSYGTIVTSSNGTNWTLRESDVTNDLYDVAYGNNTFMVVGENVNLLYKYPNVIYMGNGNTGGDEPTDSKTYQSGESATVLGNTGSLVKNGYTFAGWNTLETGNGTSYAVDDTITMDMGNVTLYAKWTKNPTYKVTYNGNGYTSGNVPTDSGEYEENASVTVLGNTGDLVKSGYTFAGWNTQADGTGTDYAATFTMGTTNVTLYAKWTKNPTYKVTYNGNGYTSGNEPTDVGEYEENASVTVQGNTGDLVKSGYTFAGWNTLADGTGTDYAATFTMGTTNVTLYAKWSASGSGSSGSSGSGVPSNSNLNGRLTLPAGASGELSFENAVKIFIPSGATDKEVRIAIEGILETENLLTNEQHPVSKVFGISKDISENFKKMVTISFAFEMSKLAEGQHPAVFYYDEKKKEWVEVAGGKVAGNWISVEVNEFAKFTVLAVEKANAPVEPTDEFSDISKHWAATNIKQAVLSGFVSGYPNGMFKPDANVTRAEFVVMLMNALKLQVDRAEMTFTDTALIGTWAQESEAQAVQAGIISGFRDGSLRPDTEITRTEMVVMIAKALALKVEANTVTDFVDDAEIPNWAKGHVAVMKNLGLISGKGNHKFAPNDKATRAEAVTILLKMIAQRSK